MRSVYAWLTTVDGCFDYRIRLPFTHLPPADWRVGWGPAPAPGARFDVVVGQRLTGENQRWLDLCADPDVLAVYDMDDDLVYLEPENEVPYSIYHPVADETAKLVAAADAVTVCTEHVAEVIASRLNPRVFLLPICMDPALLARRTPLTDDLAVGWSGSVFHRHDWSVLAGALAQVAAVEPALGFAAVGADYSAGAFGPRTRPTAAFVPWPAFLDSMAFDIGLAPLSRSQWNRGKSWTKPLEYATRGIPVIAEHWGQYPAWVVEGVNGLLAREPEDWVRHIRALVNDRDMLRELSDGAFARAQRQTIDQHAHLWAQAYEG